MIALIDCGDLKYCPYINRYLELINEADAEYEVLFWNRESAALELAPNYITYELKSELHKSPIYKIADFYGFRNWVIQQINKKRYDKIILLSTLSGMVIFDSILKNYKNKYIFDIRDYSYEQFKIFKEIESLLIKNSFFTCISSLGFQTFLAKKQSYVIAHNISNNDFEYSRSLRKKQYGETLNLVWNGVIRRFHHQSKIINHLKNNDRFNMVYHGSGPDLNAFKEFCSQNNIKNVSFTGSYANSDKHKLLADADILNNSYGLSTDRNLKYAISNKYYDGLIFGIPQLVEKGTYKERLADSAHIGIGLDVNDNNFAERLYDYYYSLDENIFNENCEKALVEIVRQDQTYTSKIKEFINN